MVIGERSEPLSTAVNRDFRYVYIFLYICVVRQSLYAHASLLRERISDDKKTKSSVSVYVDSYLDS